MTDTAETTVSGAPRAWAPDAADPLEHLRERFYREPDIVYLDGSWLILRDFSAKAIYSGNGSHLP